MPRKGENVYHRKDGLWEARYVKEIDAFGKRKLGSVYARSYREVKEKRQEIVDNIRLNQIKPTTRNTTVVQLINEWLYINKDRLKPSSYQKYQGFLRKHIEPYLGKQPVMYFTTISIHQYSMDRIQNGVSPHTVNAVLAFIRSCLKYGHRQYGLPLPDVIYHAQIKKEMRVLTQEEQRKLTAYLLEDTDIYKFGVLLALYTGLRVGELAPWSGMISQMAESKSDIQCRDSNVTMEEQSFMWVAQKPRHHYGMFQLNIPLQTVHRDRTN